MRKGFAAPLVSVKRTEKGPQGQARGTIATRPAEVDAIIRKAYGEIYKGNVEGHEECVKEYIEEYDRFIFKAPEATIEPLTGKRLKVSMQDAKESAAGMGQWVPADFKLLSNRAY